MQIDRSPSGGFSPLKKRVRQRRQRNLPYWPGHPASAHWDYPDPSEMQGSDDEKRAAFKKTLHAIKHRLDLLVNLDPGKLGKPQLQACARELSNGC